MPEGVVNYGAFLAAAFLFAVTPGLDTAFVLGKALGAGRRAALITAFGINAGVLVHTVVGALGLSALLAASSEAFLAVKWAGALYLVWLGLNALFSKAQPFGALGGAGRESAWTSFRSGLIANVLNPKVALFVLAFFPQFITDEAQGRPLPFILLGLSYAGVGLLWYLCFAWCAGSLGGCLKTHPAFGRISGRLSGVVFILLGLRMALAER